MADPEETLEKKKAVLRVLIAEDGASKRHMPDKSDFADLDPEETNQILNQLHAQGLVIPVGRGDGPGHQLTYSGLEHARELGVVDDTPPKAPGPEPEHDHPHPHE